MTEVIFTKRWTRAVGLTLVAVVLVTFLTQCRSFSGVDPMTEDGWEEIRISHLGDHNITFVSYRDAEREGPIASVSMRLEGSIGPMETLTKEHMLVRSELMRVQIDCTKHAHRPVGRYTLFQDNNLKGVSRAYDVSATEPWTPYGGPSSPLMAIGSNRSDWEPQSPGREPLAWDVIATAVCARTAPHPAEGK